MTNSGSFAVSSTTFPVQWNTTGLAGSKNGEDDENERVLSIITYVGAAVSIVGILLTLFSYMGYRKFSVKRTHIVVVNLCMSLLLYFISFIISNSARQHTTMDKHVKDHSACIAGAFLCHLGVLSSWFWAISYWALLVVMYKRPLGGHINNFFFKTALPSYGISLVFAAGSIIVAHALGDLDESSHAYFSDRCFVANNYLYVGLLLPFLLPAAPMIGMFIYLARGVMKNEQRNIQRVKSHLIKISIITVVFTVAVVLSVIIVPELREYGSTANLIAVACFTAGSTALGLLLMFFFCIHQKEIRSHWMAVVTGNDSIHHRSMSKGTMEALGIRRSSHKRSVGNNCSIPIEVTDESERKLSTIRILPKDDMDMSTLGLIQIPGTPSPEHDAERMNGTAQKENDTGRNLEVIDEHTSLKVKGHHGKSPFGKLHEGKSRSKSSSSNDGIAKHSSNKRQQSEDHIVIGKSHRKEPKRRSLSTSHNQEVPLTKRSSIVSTDSAEMTNFE
ncbi:adhesion G-protein coupled receptor G2-like isoform X1 [Clavelina lepadiformis]|uniref:adhesion G-protein coupled receptor G2-like isoform X1 n=1 Tax=Clavelina lepadiformis TaxID=159417 RepID=UPI004041FF43